MARRTPISAIIILMIVAFFSVSWLFSSSDSGIDSLASSGDGAAPAPLTKDSAAPPPVAPAGGEFIDSSILTGESIAPKLENATIKAELGRSSWKLFHTMMARFPEAPSADDSLALKTYIHLFARLYPCGDCAAHFRMLLAKYPPQVSSRQAAAGWACFVHNEVNTRLEKEIFDCNTIGDFYDCGCGEEGKEGEKKEGEAGEKGDPVELRGDSS